jgi:uncharacterized protein
MKRILIFILLAQALIAGAQIPKPQKNTYVNDFAHVLTKADKKILNQQIFKVEQESGIQLAIVLVKKLPAEYDIKDFALLIGRKWHVGTQKRGLVYVAAIDQHLQRIEVARNLDSVFTGAKCAAILAAMKDAYRNQDYSGGLQILVNKVHDEVAPAATPAVQNPVAAAPQAGAPATDDNDTLHLIIGLLAIFGLPLLLFIYFYSRRVRQNRINRFYNTQQNNPGYNPNYNQQYNYGDNNYGPGYGPGYGRPHTSGTVLRNFAAGAIIGGAAGYAARAMQDNINDVDNQQNPGYDNMPPADNRPLDDNDNTPNNWGNWGSDDSSAGSSDYDSSSGSSYDSSSDSGFSSSDDSSGATSSW